MFRESPAVLSAPTTPRNDPQANESPGAAGSCPAVERGTGKVHCPKILEDPAEQKVEVHLGRI